tara:strand:- start:581 stop:2632 length:2052 start_codon:yes stop_codon:yes gene_type:complete
MKNLVLFLSLYSLAHNQTFDVSIPEHDTASYNYADFRIWINDTLDTIRGIYWFMHHNNGDSRNIVNDSAYQSLVNGQGFALLGARIYNMHMSTGIGDAVIAAMDSFAVHSGHEELSYTPFFINGYSWGGQFGYHFTKWAPDRILGLITQKGGYHDTSYAGLAMEVPTLMIVGEEDFDYRIENLTGIFLNHRPYGAKWILAMEPGAGHNEVIDYNFLHSFFNKVIELRLNNYTNLFEPITLNPLSNTIGWLGNQNTYRIGSWDCYDGILDSSSWFPSKNIGEYWQNFVTDLATDTSVCDINLDSSYVYFTIGIHGLDSISNYTITTNNQSLIEQCRLQLALPENERNLHVNGYLDSSDGGFNLPWNWHIKPNEWELTEFSIGTCNGNPEDVEQNLDYWIDSIGQLCNWNSYIKNEIITTCEGITLWENCYLIENTTELYLSGNNLSGNIPSEIGQLINLNHVNLSFNQLDGTIPSSFGSLQNLNTLSLSDNQLIGEIPQEIGALENLEVLYLNNNRLSGNIPDIFNGLDNLNQLGLFDNELIGAIPNSLCEIYSQMDYLNLNGNRLCPPFPDCLVSDDIGYQDTSGCGHVSIMNGTISSQFRINGVFPNPFNPIAKVNYTIPYSGKVKISIYDSVGRMIISQSNYQKKGTHTFHWDADDQVSGIYFLELNTLKQRSVTKLLLMK